MNVRCNICASPSALFGTQEVLKKYQVSYFRCGRCSFMQTEEPYWLDEAYSSAIASQDVGIMQRNIGNWEITAAILNLLLPEVRSCVDYGAGHGIFVRLMRDKGFDFSWYDLHATNDYARGFEYDASKHYDFLTAFEVLEHLTHPLDELEKFFAMANNVFVSTSLVPQPAPALKDWWYYLPSSGQHVSFYTPQSLQWIAQRFGKHLLSVGPYHLFTAEPKSDFLLKIATRYRLAQAVNLAYRRPTLTGKDWEQMLR